MAEILTEIDFFHSKPTVQFNFNNVIDPLTKLTFNIGATSHYGLF